MLGPVPRLPRQTACLLVPKFVRPISLTAMLGALVLLTARSEALAQGPQLPAVVVAPVVQRDVVAEQTFIGTAQSVRTSIVGSAVEGRVLHLLVEEGDAVTEGQLLCELRTQTQEIALNAAQAELELRQYELEEMQNGSRPEEIAQAQAEYEAANAVWEYAKSALDRSRALYERGQTISQDQYEEDLSVANAARQRLAAAQARLELVQAGTRAEQIEQARARVGMAQAEVDRIIDLLEKYTIEAPFDGYVVRKETEVGQWIRSGEPVVEIVQINPIDVQVSVPETYIPNVEVGSAVTVTLDSMPGNTLEGTVSRIVPQADLRARTFPVMVRLDNPDGRLKAGMIARVSMAVDRRTDALLVPKDALVLGGPTPQVFMIEGENPATVRPVPVQSGLATGNLIQITGDIQPGTKVVIEGNERVFAGTPVSILREQPTE